MLSMLHPRWMAVVLGTDMDMRGVGISTSSDTMEPADRGNNVCRGAWGRGVLRSVGRVGEAGVT